MDQGRKQGRVPPEHAVEYRRDRVGRRRSERVDVEHRLAQHVPALDVFGVGTEERAERVDRCRLSLIEQPVARQEPSVTRGQAIGEAGAGSQCLMGLLASIPAGPPQGLRPSEMRQRKGRVGLYRAGVGAERGIPRQAPVILLALEIRAERIDRVGRQ